MNPSDDELLAAALAVRQQSYSPYSGFAVGAAVLADDGRVFTGCNVENLSFGLTICAERAAIMGAVAAGVRKIVKVAVVADSDEPITPCGACRQTVAEFADSGLVFVCSNLADRRFSSTLGELFPRAKAGILNQPNA